MRLLNIYLRGIEKIQDKYIWNHSDLNEYHKLDWVCHNGKKTMEKTIFNEQRAYNEALHTLFKAVYFIKKLVYFIFKISCIV